MTGDDETTRHDPVRVGRIQVVPVCEGFAPLALAEELPGRDVDWGAERRRFPWAFVDERSWAWHVHAFAVRTPERLVLVDSGLGSFPPYRPWAWRTDRKAALERARVRSEDVRDVVLTHLHADHSGGVAGHDGTPRFPNARVHVHEADRRHFGSRNDGDGYHAAREVSALDGRGLVATTDEDHEVSPGVRVLHTPGHTPGHRSVLIEDGGERLLLTGDLLHLPAQVRVPEWPSSHDVDAVAGARSRAALLARARRGGWLVGVSHFGRPFGRVEPGVEADRGVATWRSAMP